MNTSSPLSDLPKNTNNVAPIRPAEAPAQAGDDLLAFIRAVRLLWKHRKWTAGGTFLFTIGGG